MKICGFNKTTLLDYPGRVACTIFLGGCNFRCPFCQNGALVVEPDTQPEYSQEEILAFLKKRKGILDGVCISGGEPTLAPELPEFLSRIRELGYDVKLDTNGSRPSVVKNLAAADLINRLPWISRPVLPTIMCLPVYMLIWMGSGKLPDGCWTDTLIMNFVQQL